MVPVSLPLSVLVVTIPLMVSITMFPTATTSTTLTETKAWSGCLSVVEVNTWRWPVGVVGDGEIHADFEPGDLSSIQGISGLLRVVLRLEIDEGKAARSLGWTVQDHLNLLDLAEASELSVQVALGGREIQPKHSQTFRDSRVFPVPVDLGGSGKAPGPRSGLGARPGGVGPPGVARSAPASGLARPAARS